MFTRWRSINQEKVIDVTCLLSDEVSIKKKVVRSINQEKGSDVTCLLGDEVAIKNKVVT